MLTNRELKQRIGSVYEHARLATLNSDAAKPPADFGPSAEEMLRSIITINRLCRPLTVFPKSVNRNLFKFSITNNHALRARAYRRRLRKKYAGNPFVEVCICRCSLFAPFFLKCLQIRTTQRRLLFVPVCP